MSMIKKMATAGAVAVMGLGLGAASSSAAYSISGGAYTGAPAASATEHSFTVAGAYTITCPKPSTSFSGTATGADNTSFTPYYGANDSSPNGTGYVCEFFGFPSKVVQSGTWNVKVTGNSGTTYTGQINIPSGSTTTLDVPIAGCTTSVAGPQTFNHGGANVGTAVNVSGGVNLTAVVNNVALASASGGCPFTTSDTAVYNTNGAVSIPGITVAGP